LEKIVNVRFQSKVEGLIWQAIQAAQQLQGGYAMAIDAMPSDRSTRKP
jgi:hypothetical protein